MSQDIRNEIERFWDEKDKINFTQPEIKQKIVEVLSLLDNGELRVCQKINGDWVTNEWIKKGILLSFKALENNIFSSGISNARRGQYSWYDKVYLKTSSWVEDDWTKRNFLSLIHI